jgi:23S rRNA (adenine2030-N6)-methyltransferase
MNYRHAYHAGNFADVLKHVTLALIIEYLKKKDAAFRIIDTHAGRGAYALDSVEALKTREWEGGVGRFLGPDAELLPLDVGQVMAPYLEAVRAENPQNGLSTYPGSPLIARRLMRAQDRLIANELHPDDAVALKKELARDRRAKVLTLDGWDALKSLLPPRERRGIVLIDPPFEQGGEFERLADGLAAGLRRFATGVFLAWFPIKGAQSVARFHDRLSTFATEVLRVELRLSGSLSPDDFLNGCGLIVANPPYSLEGELAAVLPELVRRLGRDPAAAFRMTTVAPRPGAGAERK